jgi:hypothetical protein
MEEDAGRYRYHPEDEGPKAAPVGERTGTDQGACFLATDIKPRIRARKP